MSQDQRPAKIKTVSTRAAAGAAAAAPGAPGIGDGAINSAAAPNGDANAHAAMGDSGSGAGDATPRGGIVGPAILFLLACAAGGAGVVALPHFVQGSHAE